MQNYKRMDSDAMKAGLINKVGGVKNFAVLSAIAAFADKEGNAFPSQDTIAELVGYSRRNITRIIADLRNVIINDEYILHVTVMKTKAGRKNHYKLGQNSGFLFKQDRTVPSQWVRTEPSYRVRTALSQEEDSLEELKEINKERTISSLDDVLKN